MENIGIEETKLNICNRKSKRKIERKNWCKWKERECGYEKIKTEIGIFFLIYEAFLFSSHLSLPTGKEAQRVYITYLKHFANIASTKNLMSYGELLRIIRREIRSKDAIFGTTPSQKLA